MTESPTIAPSVSLSPSQAPSIAPTDPPTNCGSDCFGLDGCLTSAGRCIRFTCRSGSAGANFCQSCMGPDWEEVSYNDWHSSGYCQDVTDRYRLDYGTSTMCGDGSGLNNCCSDTASCAGGDNAWHFWDGSNTYYTGPQLGSDDANCLAYNSIDNSAYDRLTACERTTFPSTSSPTAAPTPAFAAGCSTAETVFVGSTYLGSTLALPAATSMACGVGSTTSPGVWYHTTGTGGTITVSSCHSSTDYNNMVSRSSVPPNCQACPCPLVLLAE